MAACIVSLRVPDAQPCGIRDWLLWCGSASILIGRFNVLTQTLASVSSVSSVLWLPTRAVKASHEDDLEIKP